MNKREFLMLAHEYDPKKHDVSRWWLSEKLDGQRAFWDGGLSRGLPASDVPYANTAKDGRYIEPPRATGLWSRYGKVIHAPAEWLDALPQGMNLDMELWMGRGTFQLLRTVTSTLTPSVESWRQVTGCVIDAPGWLAVLADGQLTGANWQGWLHRGMLEWVEARSQALFGRGAFTGLGLPDECFRRLRQARALSESSPTWKVHDQHQLPLHPDDAKEVVESRLHEVTAAGGEGLILRRGAGPWVPKRTWDVLKVKKLHDMEGVVIGFTWGRETDKGSKHLGRMGALILSIETPKGQRRLELSGFTDDERSVERVSSTPPIEVSSTPPIEVVNEGIDRAGKDASEHWYALHFPRGSRVTFTYRELTDDGIPKEARYWRRRES